MNKNQIKKEFQENFLELREIMKSWALIPGSPPDEFDSINHQILSHLYNGVEYKKVTHILEKELSTFYGLSTDLKNTKKMATKIIKWWDFKKSNKII